jgi:hypothetical protein
MAAGSLLSLSAIFALGASGCSKGREVSLLPSLSKASKEADEQKKAQEREEALAGTQKSKPGKAEIASDDADSRPTKGVAKEVAPKSKTKVASLESETADVTPRPKGIEKRRVGLGEFEPTGNASSDARLGQNSVDAPEPAARKESLARKAASDEEGSVKLGGIAGASWAGDKTRPGVNPAVNEQPAKEDRFAKFKPGADAETEVAEPAPRSFKKTASTDPATDKSVTPKADQSDGVWSTSRNEKSSAKAGESRFQVDRLMTSAQTLLDRGEVYAAYRTALLAERVAIRDSVRFEDEERTPADLVTKIRGEIEQSDLSTAQAGDTPRNERRITRVDQNSTLNMPAELEEATRLASWRAESTTAIETTRFEAKPSSNAQQSFDRKPFEPITPETVASSPSDRSAPRTWPPRGGAGADAARSSTLTPETSNSAPVVLSSAISAEDDLKPSADVRGVINAIAEQPNVEGADFVIQADPHPKASSSQLFVPALPSSTAQETLFAPAPPEESTLALAGKSNASTVGSVDLIDEELLMLDADKPGVLSNHFWTIMGIVIAAGAVLFGLLRQARGKKNEA